MPFGNPITGGVTVNFQSGIFQILDKRWSTDVDVVADFGAKGDNATDSFTSIYNAIQACPVGGRVIFPPYTQVDGTVVPGRYVVSNSLPLRDNISYVGLYGNRWQAYTGQPAYIKPLFGAFNGDALFVANETSGWRMENMSLHSGRATGPAGADVHGIKAIGKCKGVRLDRVWINNYHGYAIKSDTSVNGFPGGWEITQCDIENNSLGGFRFDNSAAQSFAFADGVLSLTEFTANGGDDFYAAGIAAYTFLNVRNSFGDGNGVFIDGPSGSILFLGHQTDRCRHNGIYLKASDSLPTQQPSPHSIAIIGGAFSRDGRNDDVSAAGYAAIRVEGVSAGTRHIPVTIQGIVVHVTNNDNGSGLLSPDYGVYSSNSRRTLIQGCVLVGTVAPIFDDLGTVRDFMNWRATVNPGTGAVTNNTPGEGLTITEGTDGMMGQVTLVAGTITVNNVNVKANSRIFLTRQSLGGAAGDLRVSAKVAGTSFTITSASGTDTSQVAYQIINPA